MQRATDPAAGLSGIVRRVTYKGQFTEYAVDVGGAEVTVSVNEREGEVTNGPGSSVHLTWDDRDAVIFPAPGVAESTTSGDPKGVAGRPEHREQEADSR